MVEVTLREALRQAIDEEMQRDKSVFLMGEDIGEYQGAYKVSQGLLYKYGHKRVLDTPITEESFTGIGIGAAMVGLRPIIEWMTLNFSLVAMDQVINNAAKMRYMSGGQVKIPIVFRGPNGPAEYLSCQHSQALESYYVHCPGLLVVAPSNPYDAKGLLKTAIRDDNPIVFLESEMIYGLKGEIPEEEYLVPLGELNVKRKGTDVTLISYSKSVHLLENASEILSSQEGIEAEVLDLRSLRPLDEKRIYESIRKTHACVIVSESWPMASFVSYLAWLISKNCFDDLDAPIEIVCSEDIPLPYNHLMEMYCLPSVEKILSSVKKVLYL